VSHNDDPLNWVQHQAWADKAVEDAERYSRMHEDIWSRMSIEAQVAKELAEYEAYNQRDLDDKARMAQIDLERAAGDRLKRRTNAPS
jgi:tellurite resistance protein